MGFTTKKEENFYYLDEGNGEVLLLLHGLFGSLSNWDAVVKYFSTQYRVIIPVLPITTLPYKSGLEELVSFVESFILLKQLNSFTLIGNSLGGHISLMYTLKHPDKVKKLVLTGSSGLFEAGMGSSFPKRGNYDYIKEKTKHTFYDPNIVTEDMILEIMETLKDNSKCLNIIKMAKSAQRKNMSQELSQITTTTLLIWGLNDTITPPIVAHEFHSLLPHSTLHFLDHCCHVPMMEKPNEFNELLMNFLKNK